MRTKILGALLLFAVAGAAIVIMMVAESSAAVLVRDPLLINAQISAVRPTRNLSEVRAVVHKAVEDISNNAKSCGLKELTGEEKNQLAEGIISRMKAQGTYDFIE